jgi:serine protease Do
MSITMNKLSRPTLVLTACVASLIFSALCAESQGADKAIAVLKETSKAFNKVAKDCMPAVVFLEIETDFNEKDLPKLNEERLNDIDEEWLRKFFKDYYNDQNRERFRQAGQGTGFIVSKDGYIVTNAHIADNADRIKVKLHDGSSHYAEIIGSDSRSDVALIKIKTDSPLPVVTIGNSEDIEIGEWAIAIGNPFGLTATLTVGVISAVGRNNIGIADYENFIQTDAAINPGNSGGPLLNIDGKVIGMNTAIYSRTGGSMGVGFAIPINMVMKIKEQLQEHGKVIRGFLGIIISDVDDEVMKQLKLKHAFGIRVDRILEQSAAKDAGLEIDDVIVDINGSEIRNVAGFRNRVALMPPGTSLDLRVIRNGEARTVSAVTGVHPDEVLALRAIQAVDQIGLEVSAIDDETALAMGYDKNVKGVLVTRVEKDSDADKAGLEPGELIISINRKTIRNKEGYEAALKKAVEAGTIMLRVRNKEAYRLITIDPGEE